MPYTYEFPRPSLTVDVVALTSEAEPRVLLIKRGQEPFAGRWALPGGFVNENEPLEAAARRELEEETGLKVPLLEQVMSVGDPGRDPRGWTISVIHLAEVGNVPPQVKASDDAADVEWFELRKLPKLAFDHAAILQAIEKRFFGGD